MSRFAGSASAGFKARRQTKSPQELRADWVAAIAEAGFVAAQAEGAEDATASAGLAPRSFGQALTRLTVRLRDLEGANFPAGGDAAKRYAAAFLMQARAFAHPATPPETRTACAPALRASARVLDRWLCDLRAAEAPAGRRMLGEREDEA